MIQMQDLLNSRPSRMVQMPLMRHLEATIKQSKAIVRELELNLQNQHHPLEVSEELTPRWRAGPGVHPTQPLLWSR